MEATLSRYISREESLRFKELSSGKSCSEGVGSISRSKVDSSLGLVPLDTTFNSSV